MKRVEHPAGTVTRYTSEHRTTVSAVVPAYNSAHLLQRCLASIFAQSRPVDEILVINDGSTDNTAEVLAGYGPLVRAIHQPNGGGARARNKGILEARGEWIAFLDADDQWLPQKIEKQLALAAERPDAGLLFTDALVVNFDGVETGRYLDGKGAGDGWAFDRLLSCFFILPSTTLVRRILLLQEGMFSSSLRRTEDYELWLRLSRRCPFAMSNEALTRYERQPGSVTCNDLAEHQAHVKLFTELLAQELTPAQRILIEQRLEKTRFALAWELRKSDPAAALRASCSFLASHPVQPAAWKLAAGSLAARARGARS